MHATTTDSLAAWAAAAREKFTNGTLTEADFDALDAVLAGKPKQWLMMMHVTEPTIYSAVIACNVIEPNENHMPELLPTGEFDWPYPSVFDAMKDGWHVIQFPRIAETVHEEDDDEPAAIGYEYILQKIEVMP